MEINDMWTYLDWWNTSDLEKAHVMIWEMQRHHSTPIICCQEDLLVQCVKIYFFFF